jgi:hypothetical protein
MHFLEMYESGKQKKILTTSVEHAAMVQKV